MKSRVDEILNEIELDYLERVEGDINKRQELLPLENTDQVKALLWNLLSDERYRSKISYEMYSEILDELLGRMMILIPEIDYDVVVKPPVKSFKVKAKIRSITKFTPRPFID